MKAHRVARNMIAFGSIPFFILGFLFQFIRQAFGGGQDAVQDLTDWIDVREAMKKDSGQAGMTEGEGDGVKN